MFTSISHELRTPLNAVVNSLQLGRVLLQEIKEKLNFFPEAINSIESMLERAERLVKIGDISAELLVCLIEDILDLAKFSSDIFELNLKRFTLGSIISKIDYIFFNFQWKQKKLSFGIFCDPEIASKEMHTDPMRLKQILINLLSNSFKFTEHGEIIVKVSHDALNSLIWFSVEDTGVGISKTNISKLFKMFSIGSSQQHMYNQFGIGVGLSLFQRKLLNLWAEL